MRITSVLCLALVLPLAAGCAGPNAQATGAFGTVAGAATGAIIGAGSGNSAEGAVIGAVAGGLGGTVLGRAADRRDAEAAAIQQASYEHDMAVAHARAVTAQDLVSLTHNGVSEDVIRSMIVQRGSNVDLSPGGVIYLKQQGVADGVILAAQQAGTIAAGPVPVPPPVQPVVQPVVIERHYESFGPPPIVIHRGFGPGRCRPRVRRSGISGHIHF